MKSLLRNTSRVCSLFLFTAVMLAQANRATITGTIADSSGAVVPNAEVTATNDGTKVATRAVSNNNGLYSLLNLPPGTYTVTAKRDGFKTVDFPYVTLIVDQVVELNVTLTVGASAEQVTVTTDAPTLDRETSTIGTNMNGNVVTDLPLNVYGGRQAENFAVALAPGYSPLSNPYRPWSTELRFSPKTLRWMELPAPRTCKATLSNLVRAWRPLRNCRPRLAA